jgi:hypothetical protein
VEHDPVRSCKRPPGELATLRRGNAEALSEAQRLFIALRMSFSLILPVFFRISPSVVSGLNPGIGSDRFLFFVSLRLR